MPTPTRPIAPATLTEMVRRRFYAKVAAPDENGCRLWQAALGTKGYGSFGLTGRGMVSAHRVAYVLAHGEDIPLGRMIDHTCRVRHCVNPDHLRVVTNRENLRADKSEHWARAQVEQTHCLRGHPLIDENLVPLQQRRGRRQCQACQRAQNRLYYRRRKHGISWTEDEVRALADEIYAQHRKPGKSPSVGGGTGEQAVLFSTECEQGLEERER